MGKRSISPDIDGLEIAEDRHSEPFWAAARDCELVAMRCAECSQFRMPPSPFCPNCRSQEVNWLRLSGRGTIYSFTIIPPRRGEEETGCLVPALVELEDAPGIRIMSNIVDSNPADIVVGTGVRLVWQQRADGVSFPRFVLENTNQEHS